MKNLKRISINSKTSNENRGNQLEALISKGFTHSKSDNLHRLDYIPNEGKLYKNLRIEGARKEYFESLILDFESRWDNKLIVDSPEFKSNFYELLEELETYLYTHSIYFKAKKYCTTIYKFEITRKKLQSPSFYLKGYYSNFKSLRNLFEDKKSYSINIKTKCGEPICIQLFEGFIQEHPECILEGKQLTHPLS